MGFPGMGTHITRAICFPGRGTNITRAMCFLGRGTHSTRDMCFVGSCSCPNNEQRFKVIRILARHLQC